MDTKTEAYKFQDKVETAYNYGEISLEIAKEMGFVGHRKQGSKSCCKSFHTTHPPYLIIYQSVFLLPAL